MRLKDKFAVVTGGARGIGLAIAKALAREGAAVAIADINLEGAKTAAAAIGEQRGRAIPVTVDVADPASISAMVAGVLDAFGRIDILVNNAGGVSPRAFTEQSERSWRRHIDLNLVSVLAATSAAVPVMIRGARGGSIINITSIEGSRAAPNYAVYAACKAGINNFTRTLAVELADHRVRVNAIAPDMTDTPGLHGNRDGPIDPATWVDFSAEQKEAIARRIPLGRPGIDTECGSAAVFLASRMGSYVSGIILPVDGGTWASGGWVRSRTSPGKWVLIE